MLRSKSGFTGEWLTRRLILPGKFTERPTLCDGSTLINPEIKTGQVLWFIKTWDGWLNCCSLMFMPLQTERVPRCSAIPIAGKWGKHPPLNDHVNILWGRTWESNIKVGGSLFLEPQCRSLPFLGSPLLSEASDSDDFAERNGQRPANSAGGGQWKEIMPCSWHCDLSWFN